MNCTEQLKRSYHMIDTVVAGTVSEPRQPAGQRASWRCIRWAANLQSKAYRARELNKKARKE